MLLVDVAVGVAVAVVVAGGVVVVVVVVCGLCLLVRRLSLGCLSVVCIICWLLVGCWLFFVCCCCLSLSLAFLLLLLRRRRRRRRRLRRFMFEDMHWYVRSENTTPR